MRSRLATSFALFGLILALAMAAGAEGAGVASRSALSAKVPTTVYDPVLHVSWLADANLPARMKFGLAINKDGSMSYQTAVQWVRRLNRNHFLGHGDWTLPITPTPYRDMGCSGRNKKGGGSFGLGCSKSPLAWLYTHMLGLRWPDTAVAIPDTTTGPFHDFQPYLYWTGTPAQTAGGLQTFSFNTGWSGSNQTDHFMYVLPMLAGNPFVGTATSGLQSVDGGQAVWEPGAGPAGAGITWLADADLARTEHFSLPDMFGTDGSMAGKAVTLKGKTVGGTAGDWVQALRTNHWLGERGWSLPTLPELAALYTALNLTSQEPVVPVPVTQERGFRNIQPYLYWSCAGKTITGHCHGAPNPNNQQWSFSFGNGYLGTDVTKNDLYVTAYYPTPTPPPIPRCPPPKPGQPSRCT